jgi:glycosyltransferase involved in cell wall biosynthesis
MHVCFITDAPRIAGSETWLAAMLPELKNFGIVPKLMIRQAEKLDWLEQTLTQGGVAVERYTALADTIKASQTADMRVLQAWDYQTYFFLARLASPKMVVVHDQLEYAYPWGLRYVNRASYLATKTIGLKLVDRVVTVSDWGTDFLRKKLLVPKAVGIKNGVDVQKFVPPTPQQKAHLRQELGFSRFTVLVPGRMTFEKSQPMSIRIAAKLPNYDFVFIGDDDSFVGQYSKRLAQGLSNVHFWGRKSNVLKLYQAADAVLQPTLAENQSLVTLEAMASGIPIVSSNIPAQTEMIQHGKTGLAVPVRLELLVQAVDQLATDPKLAGQLAQNARLFVETHHTLRKSAGRFAAVLQASANPK